ncbi:hypothetical protein AAVH_26925 [Aphelenchoides avenae]|nr:hypothetical protein AAVH_26925 [Aphelenchus avenae]
MSSSDYIGKPLGQPHRTDVATPHSAFIKEWSRKQHSTHGWTTNESTVAELYVFENAKSARRLELFAWRVKQMHEREQASLHYAFMLRVVDT